MSRRVSKEESLGGELDDFPSPVWAVERLLEDVHYLPSGNWLEPSAGQGNIVKTVRAHLPHDVDFTCVEIQPRYHDALVPLSERVITGDDFLGDKVQAQLRERQGGHRFAFDVAIGNPPYAQAEDFIEACRKLAPIVVMLLRLNYLASAKRWPRHRFDLPEHIGVLPDRPSFRGGNGDSCEYGWFIWTQVKTARSSVFLLGITNLEARKPFDPKREIWKMLRRKDHREEREIITAIEKVAPDGYEWTQGAFVHDLLAEMVTMGDLDWSPGKTEDAPMNYRITPQGWMRIWREAES